MKTYPRSTHPQHPPAAPTRSTHPQHPPTAPPHSTTPQHHPTATHTPLWCACVCSLTLILGSGFSLAQTCPQDIEPANPPQETLAPAYQPFAYDTADATKLRRLRFTPITATWGPGPYPTVISIHPGEFRDNDDHGELHQRYATTDLTNAGFLVFQIEYRLAPPNLLQGQHPHDPSSEGIASGRPPQQTNDVKQEILAALADPLCNQKSS